MQQLSETIVVINPQDPWDERYNDFLKIYLGGSIDLSEKDWQSKFGVGLAKLCSEQDRSLDKIIKTQKYLIMNPRVMVGNDMPVVDNPEFKAKVNWELEMMEKADVIFCNFLRKSKAPSAMHGFLLSAYTQKMIVRCPMEYVNFGLIKLITDRLRIPLLGDAKTTVDVINQIYNSIPKFREILNYGL